jgi:hypothetical protein
MEQDDIRTRAQHFIEEMSVPRTVKHLQPLIGGPITLGVELEE